MSDGAAGGTGLTDFVSQGRYRDVGNWGIIGLMNTTDVTIFVVDDDALTCDLLTHALKEEGYTVQSFVRGQPLLDALERADCDLVVADIGLPDIDGYALTRRVLEQRGCGVIMVTARQDMESRLHGLEIGADAYLVKPVEPRELVATTRALLRRISIERSGTEPAPQWRFEPRLWRIIGPGEIEIPLTRSECLLLDVLIRHGGELVGREQLITGIGHSVRYYDTRRLDTAISRLRRKIHAYCPDWNPIVTERSRGYAFVAR